jgi:hypothetical protein
MATQLITAQFGTMPVFFQTDGFINATAVAKQFNKSPKDYLKSKRTQEYIESIRGILLLEYNQVVIVKNGSVENGGGTWLHPKLAIDFARWLSSDFAVWCDLQIEKILYSNTEFDMFSEFIKPITKPITTEDFEWRYHVITQVFNNLKKAKVDFVLTMTGEEFLAAKYSEN